MTKKTLILIFLFFAAIPCFGSGNKYSALLETAESSFAGGNYKKTIEIYETLVQVEKINDPDVYYNLSNAYYRNGELGKAALNIEKAFLLDPRDKDIKHNRILLGSIAGIKEHEGFDKLLNFFPEAVSLNEITVIFAAACATALVFGGVFFITGKKQYKTAALITVIFLVLSGILLSVKVKADILDVKAVALGVVVVRSGPGTNNPEIFNLSEGRIAVVYGENGAWSNIKVYPKGFSGWTESRGIEKINE